MYPSVPGANDPPRGSGSYAAYGSLPSTPAAPSNLASAQSLENSPWGADSSSILRVKIADDYKLEAPVSLWFVCCCFSSKEAGGGAPAAVRACIMDAAACCKLITLTVTRRLLSVAPQTGASAARSGSQHQAAAGL